MSTAALISIKPVFAQKIIAGEKTIELRKSSMGLKPNDVVVVYSSAPEQQIAFWFRIGEIETLTTKEMWSRYRGRLGISQKDYDAYFEGSNTATGIHIDDLHKINPIPLAAIKSAVEGFVPPQGIVWLRDELGRYSPLLARLSEPLPSDVFQQLSLNLGKPSKAARAGEGRQKRRDLGGVNSDDNVDRECESERFF